MLRRPGSGPVPSAACPSAAGRDVLHLPGYGFFPGWPIHPGSLYISYRPLLENITTNEKFVLERTIHVETGYLYNLPRRIDELEALEQDMILETPGQEIDFNHFNNQMGGRLPLKKLKKERRKFYDKNRNSKRP